MAKGYIYIMTNESFKQPMIKIGYAKDVEQRRKQLSEKTGVPADYKIYATYETAGNIEDKDLHNLIDKLNPNLRFNKAKEFYVLESSEAFNILKSIATISGTLDKLKKIESNEKPKFKKRPPINFYECDLKQGDKLIYKDDPTVVAYVENEHKVLYDGESTSLSGIIFRLTGKHVAGPLYFKHNDKLLTDIANSTQWKDYK